MSEWITAGKVRMTPKGVYSSSSAYEILDIVSSTNGLISYIAKKAVPAGTALTNTEYWAVLNDISEAAANVNDALYYIAATEESPATAAHTTGEYLIYNGNLYKVTAAIAVGDTLITGTNIVQLVKGISGEVADLRSILEDSDTIALLHMDEINNTVQSIVFDGSGNVSAITHVRDNVTIREDEFTFGNGTITEVRTLSTGETLTIVTNTNTLQTTITYADA